MAKFFDVGITHGADDSITHTLSTTLIGPDGKVAAFYPGNEWTRSKWLGMSRSSREMPDEVSSSGQTSYNSCSFQTLEKLVRKSGE